MVFPRRVDGERYVGEVVELLDEEAFSALDSDERNGIVRKQGVTVYWNTIAWRTEDGDYGFAYDHPELGGTEDDCTIDTFSQLAAMTDRSTAAVEREFRRKHRYVEHMVREGIDNFDTTFDLLADLQTNEAATVERLTRKASNDRAGVSHRETGSD